MDASRPSAIRQPPFQGMMILQTMPTNDMVHLSQTWRALIWSLLAAIAVLLCVLAFRGYLSGDLLLNFANMFYC